jgi:hypothetical protein
LKSLSSSSPFFLDLRAFGDLSTLTILYGDDGSLYLSEDSFFFFSMGELLALLSGLFSFPNL